MKAIRYRASFGASRENTAIRSDLKKMRLKKEWRIAQNTPRLVIASSFLSRPVSKKRHTVLGCNSRPPHHESYWALQCTPFTDGHTVIRVLPLYSRDTWHIIYVNKWRERKNQMRRLPRGKHTIDLKKRPRAKKSNRAFPSSWRRKLSNHTTMRRLVQQSRHHTTGIPDRYARALSAMNILYLE